MAFKHGSNAKLYANGYNLTGYLSKVTTSGKNDLADVTTLGKTAKNYLGDGPRDATMQGEGFFDGDAGAVDEIMAAALGAATDTVLCHWPQGESAVNDKGRGMAAEESSYEVESPVDGAVAVTFEAQSKTSAERIASLHPLAAETVTGDGTTVDDTAQSTNGGSAYLQVTTVAGTGPGLIAVVQHSDNGSDWADLITFTAVSASNTAERKEVSGTVKRYVRASWTISGTNTPSMAFSIAFHRE